MALSKGFFGLRRGSTKSHTYSVYKGQQVTKDRVYDVTNPQTEAQMKQRLKLPIVSVNLSLLEGLVNHSFEGYSYGDESLAEFKRRNLSLNTLTIKEYVPKGITDCGLSDLVISDGTLKQITVENDPADNGLYNVNYLAPNDEWEGELFKTNVSKGTVVPADMLSFLFKFLNLGEEQQLTFLLCYQGESYTFPTSADETLSGHYHRYVISRLIGSTNSNGQWVLAKDYSYSDDDPQPIVITDNYIQLTFNTNSSYEEFEDVGNAVRITAQRDPRTLLCAAACIFSSKENGTWRRSPARLKPLVSTTNQTYENIIYGYENSVTAAKSNKYLNTGTEGVGITGGTV